MGNPWNRSNLTDPLFNEMWDDVMTELNPAEFTREMREVIAYWLELCPGFMGPGPYRRVYWQPWIKDFHGERYLAFNNGSRIWAYAWVDQDLKAEMGQ